MSTNRRPFVLPPFSTVLLGVALAACSRGAADKPEANDTEDADAPVPVEVVPLERGPIEETLRFSATLEAETAVQVLARTTGQVRSRLVEEGDAVKKDQVLLQLEREEQASALRRTQTELELAQRTFRTQKNLHDKGVVSNQSLETAEVDLKRATIARDDAARALRYTTVKAPIGGTVTQRLVKRGDLVAPNQPLFEVVDFESLVANVYVPEKDIDKVGVEGLARLATPTTGDRINDGAIRRVAPIVDPRTGTIKVTVGLADTAKLRPGMFVDVELVVAERPDAVLLPRRALVYDNDEPYAFKVIEGDKSQRVRVDIVAEDRDHVMPRAGFEAGDQVVIAGQVGLKDGARVAPQAPPSADSSADPATKPVAAEDAPTQPAGAPAGAKAPSGSGERAQ